MPSVSKLIPQQAGYSLIELLVVVGISAVLSASIVAVLQASTQGQRATQRSSQEQESTSNIFKSLYQTKNCSLEGDTNANDSLDAGENPEAFFVRPSFSTIMSKLRDNNSWGSASLADGNTLKDLPALDQNLLRTELDLGSMFPSGSPHRQKATIRTGGKKLTQGELLAGHTSICVSQIRIALPINLDDLDNNPGPKCQLIGHATRCGVIDLFRTPVDYVATLACRDESKTSKSTCEAADKIWTTACYEPYDHKLSPIEQEDAKSTCEGGSTTHWEPNTHWLPGYDKDAMASSNNKKYPGYRYNLALEVTLLRVSEWNEDTGDCKKLNGAYRQFIHSPSTKALPKGVSIKKLRVPLTIHDVYNDQLNSCQVMSQATPFSCSQHGQNPVMQVIKQGDEKSFQAWCPIAQTQGALDVSEFKEGATTDKDTFTLYGGSYTEGEARGGWCSKPSHTDRTACEGDSEVWSLKAPCLEGNPHVQIKWGLSQSNDHELKKITHRDPNKITNDCTGSEIKAGTTLSSSIKAQPTLVKCPINQRPPSNKVALCACPKGYNYCDKNNDGDCSDPEDTSSLPVGTGEPVFTVADKQTGYDHSPGSPAPAKAAIKVHQCIKIIPHGDKNKEHSKALCLGEGLCARPPMLCTAHCAQKCAGNKVPEDSDKNLGGIPSTPPFGVGGNRTCESGHDSDFKIWCSQREKHCGNG